MNRFIRKMTKHFYLPIAVSCLSLVVSCNSGIDKVKDSAEAAKEKVAKTEAYNFFPGKYKNALKLMKKAEKKMEKKQVEKSQRLYDIARKILLEINSKGPDKKEHLESSIKSIFSEIEKAKEKAKTSIDAVSDSCVSDIAGKMLGKSSSAKTIVLKYFDKLKEKTQKKFGQAEKQFTKASEIEGDANLKKKNKMLKSTLETYTTVGQIADEICKKTESMAQKSLKKKSKHNKSKKQKSQTS